jgi:hypothetical protein
MSSPENISGWVQGACSDHANDGAFSLGQENVGLATTQDHRHPTARNIPNTTGLEPTEPLWPYQKDFIWDEHLSENGQKLYLLLLGEVGCTPYLRQLAEAEGVDLDAGLAELRRHRVLDEHDPKIVRINLEAE